MTSTILVTGGTGALGRRLVPMLRDSGSKVRVLSRHEHEPNDGIEYVTSDLRTGENLEPALHGAETVVHLAGNGRRLVRLRKPGSAGRAYRAGENLNLAGATLGTRTWEEFLAERVRRG